MGQGRRLAVANCTAGIRAIHAPPLIAGGYHSIGTTGVFGIVQKATDIVHEERVQYVRDFLLVGKLQGSIKGNPESVSRGSCYAA